MKIHQHVEQQAEMLLSPRVAALQPGEEIYLPPQISVAVSNRQHLVMTSTLARRIGLVPGSEANRWQKPRT